MAQSCPVGTRSVHSIAVRTGQQTVHDRVRSARRHASTNAHRTAAAAAASIQRSCGRLLLLLLLLLLRSVPTIRLSRSCIDDSGAQTTAQQRTHAADHRFSHAADDAAAISSSDDGAAAVADSGDGGGARVSPAQTILPF